MFVSQAITHERNNVLHSEAHSGHFCLTQLLRKVKRKYFTLVTGAATHFYVEIELM